ncbi:MAG: deoxyribonuclease IV [Candidatus Eremiobacter antarcticus]|nr:deoxyribonuclease IV [Candidatus Eremiobacteraeota bacterium]MBC5807179.1 deoxyribonuclease IV [Candidatus Eremiobacteraeota bacterium]
MRFGVHVGIGGGFDRSIAEALSAGCECIQIFAGNPRGWRVTPYDAAAWSAFARERARHRIAPTVIHTSYLINLASADKSLRAKSAHLVANDLNVAAKGKVEFVNTHLGSYGSQPERIGFRHVCSLLSDLIFEAPRGPMLLLENSAGGGNRCAGSLEEIGRFVRSIGSKRVGVCLDTAHLWASGYDIATSKGVGRMLSEADKEIGLEHVRVLHLNDTKVALGARHDVHWHLGHGRIGESGFRRLLKEHALAHVACICETPKPREMDGVNVATARRLAGVRRSAQHKSPNSGVQAANGRQTRTRRRAALV